MNAQRDDGRSALHYAGKNAASVRLLLDAGANPNIQDNGGDTPLYYACYYGYPHVVRILLDSGADPYLTGPSGRTAEQRAQITLKETEERGDAIKIMQARAVLRLIQQAIAERPR